jgi:hypothetical protein
MSNSFTGDGLGNLGWEGLCDLFTASFIGIMKPLLPGIG